MRVLMASQGQGQGKGKGALSPGAPTWGPGLGLGRTAGRTLLVAATIALLTPWSTPVDGVRWLALQHAPASRWNGSLCRAGRSRWGLSAQQTTLCRASLGSMPQLVRAAQAAVATCQQLFADRRWNCSSLDLAPDFTPDLTTGTREQAYAHALGSAAVTLTLARACAQGVLSRCACAGQPRDPPDGNFKWGGCGDNVRYGAAFGRQFADAAEKRGKRGNHAAESAVPQEARRRLWSLQELPPTVVTSSKRRKSVETPGAAGAAGATPRQGRHLDHRGHSVGRAQITLLNLHNNRAGRRAVESSVVTQCKCHGVSGSCNIKTCWRALPRLAEIGRRLQRRFSSAVEVVSRRSVASGRRLVPATTPGSPDTPVARFYSQDDLIFLTKSPDYCMADPRTGSLGTIGRACNASSSGFDSCEDMCCGRGYRTAAVERVERCQCKYYWCCYVRCKTCRTWVDVHECL